MSNEQVRREFEAKFPTPEYLVWKGEYYGFTDKVVHRAVLNINAAGYNASWDGFRERQSEIDRLTTELEAAKKDVARYRWLRDSRAHVIDACGIALIRNSSMYGIAEPTAEEWDRSIDAAMEQTNG